MNDSIGSEAIAHQAAELAADRKAQDIVILDLRPQSAMTDFFVICHGRSHVQVEAICERVETGLRDLLTVRALSTEGRKTGLWGILDYDNVVVHVFQKSARDLYDLERLWFQAPRWNYDDASAKETA